MKLCISTCFPKERNSLTSHYQIWSLFIQGVTMLTAHSPTSPLWSCLPSPEGHEITAGGAGDSLEREQNHSFPHVSKLHKQRKNSVFWKTRPQLPPTTSATGSVGSSSAQPGRKLTRLQNPNCLLTGLGTEWAPQEVPSSASWWGRNTGHSPSLWWHWVISSSLTSNCFLRPPSHTI